MIYNVDGEWGQYMVYHVDGEWDQYIWYTMWIVNGICGTSIYGIPCGWYVCRPITIWYAMLVQTCSAGD